MTTESTSSIAASLTRATATYSSVPKTRATETESSTFQEPRVSATRQGEEAQNATPAEQNLPPREDPNAEQVREAVSQISSYVQNLQRDLQFEVNLELGHTVISVVDHETKEVIRQIPPEEAVERAKQLQEQLAESGSSEGLLLKVQA